MKRFFILIFFLLILVAQQSNLVIRSITVEGNYRTDKSTVRINSSLYIGKEITGFDVQRAIRNLWELRQWSYVQILAKDISPESEVDLIIRVKEYPRLNNVILNGNDEFDKDDIDKHTHLFPGMVITPFKLYKAKQQLLNAYEKEGFLLATVSIDTVNLPKNKLRLDITISEGSEVEVKRIRVFGAKMLDESDISGAMKETSENGFLGFGGDFNKKKYKQDLNLITKYIQNQGFRNGTVVRDSIYYSDNKEDMFIDIWVYEGPQFFFGNVSFQGNEILSDADFMYQMDLKKGKPYSEDKFQDAKKKITELYYNKGYLFAQVTPSEEIMGRDTVNIRYRINEQSVVRINRIRIEGNTKTNEKVIRRDIKIYPQQKFSQEKIMRSLSGLMRLNYFQLVKPDVKIIQGVQDKVDLLFDVQEKSTDQANASIGYSEIDGLVGSIGLSFNNFSFANPFQEGAGQQLALNTQFGGYQEVYSISATEPWFNDTPTLLGFSLYYSRTRKNDGKRRYRQTRYIPYNEDRLSASMTVGKTLKWPDNFFRASVSAQFSVSKLSDVSKYYLENYSFFRKAAGRTLYTTKLSNSITRDSRNSAEFPTQGSRYNLSTEWNFGDKNYLKGVFNTQLFFPLFGKVIFYTNIKMGAISRYGTDDLLLPNDLFHMGGNGLSYGTESLRGYEDRSVGDAEVIANRGSGRFISLGGDAMFKMTNELRFKIVPSPTIYGILFMENGNVWKDPASFDIFNLKRSAGVGIRLFMPLVGIIGLDVGYGFDRYKNILDFSTSPKWQFHFQFGRF